MELQRSSATPFLRISGIDVGNPPSPSSPGKFPKRCFAQPHGSRSFASSNATVSLWFYDMTFRTLLPIYCFKVRGEIANKVCGLRSCVRIPVFPHPSIMRTIISIVKSDWKAHAHAGVSMGSSGSHFASMTSCYTAVPLHSLVAGIKVACTANLCSNI